MAELNKNAAALFYFCDELHFCDPQVPDSNMGTGGSVIKTLWSEYSNLSMDKLPPFPHHMLVKGINVA